MFCRNFKDSDIVDLSGASQYTLTQCEEGAREVNNNRVPEIKVYAEIFLIIFLNVDKIGTGKVSISECHMTNFD